MDHTLSLAKRKHGVPR